MNRFTRNSGATLNVLPKSLMTLIPLLFSALASADIAQVPLFISTTAKPNVMLMLDNSISMGGTITPTGTTYDPTVTYLDGLCTATNNSNTNRAISTNPTYTTSLPSDFLGNGSGNKCFASNKSYNFDSTMNSKLSAAIANTNAKKANYANWYYTDKLNVAAGTKTRLAISKSAAINLVNSLSNVRMGFSTFNSDNGGKLWEVVDDLGSTKKVNIINRINAMNNDSSTPLAETMADIGNYFATGSNNVTLHAGKANETSLAKSSVLPSALVNGTSWSGRTAIADEPTFTSSPIQYSCQKSFALLMTDGLPSADRDIASNSYLSDYDGDCSGSNSANCGIKSGSSWLSPYYDMKRAFNYPGTCNTGTNCVTGGGSDSSDYLDDVTKALYEADLRPDLVNTGGIKNNLTTFVVGFADDVINPTIAGVNPLPKDAAIQGGGKFYFAGNELEVTASLNRAFNIIIEQNASSSSVTTNSTQFQTNSLLYQAIFDTSDWSGDLLAFNLTTEDSNANGVLDTGEDLNNNGKLDAGAIGGQLWAASEQIPTPVNRKIYSINPLLTTTNKGIEFQWINLNPSQKDIFGNVEAKLNYIRGVQTSELQNGGTYRNRFSLLGDIVNSDPLYVGRDNLGYSSLPGTEGSSYQSFATTTRRVMIYAAANDGMLHGFDASPNTTGGQEIFAYVPNAAINTNLANLTDPNYAHQYIVDGSPQAGDVYYNSSWHTVLVGSMGAGGKALFGLDITNPDAFDATKVLWEFTHADLGYTMTQASIVKTADSGQWAAVVSNGYNSTSGKSSLFVINIQTGVIIKQIDAETASGSNGLASPLIVDVDNDKIADYVYAGDLKGNMWKFDISSSNTADWGVAYSGSPLFVARDAASPSAVQPITVKPAATKATGINQGTGTMIYFGTGKYFEVGDNIVPSTPQIQTFYGIWDKCDKTTTSCTGSVSGRSALQQQSIIYEGTSGITTLADGSTVSGDVRVTSACEVAYGTTSPTTTTSPCTANTTRLGWYLDLIQPAASVGQGERVVSNAVIRHGVVIFPTLIPINQTCVPGGDSWLMEMDLFSGARIPSGTPVDLNNDDIVDANDLVKIGDESFAASGFKSTVGIIDTPAIINCENGMDCKYASGSSGNIMLKKEKAPTTSSTPGGSTKIGARRSWQQLR